MPYRVDVRDVPADALDRLVRVGALDVEETHDGLAALLPDAVGLGELAGALGVDGAAVRVSPTRGRDDDSVWTLSPRPTTVGRLTIVPAERAAGRDALRLNDGTAFGTGLHATTVLCLEALQSVIDADRPDRVLDVGTGTGILALAALRLGVPRATGVDTDPVALEEAAANARLNGLADRLDLVTGGPEAIDGAWPVVLANIVAAPLMEMAPVLVRRVAHAGTLVLSGIAVSVAPDVERVYGRRGLREIRSESRAGWVIQIWRASW